VTFYWVGHMVVHAYCIAIISYVHTESVTKFVEIHVFFQSVRSITTYVGLLGILEPLTSLLINRGASNFVVWIRRILVIASSYRDVPRS